MVSLPFRNMTLIYYQLFHSSLLQVLGTPPHLVPFTVIWHLKCNNHNRYLQPSREYTNLFLCRLSHRTGVPIFLTHPGITASRTLQLAKRLHPQETFTALVYFLDNALENGRWKQEGHSGLLCHVQVYFLNVKIHQDSTFVWAHGCRRITK